MHSVTRGAGPRQTGWKARGRESGSQRAGTRGRKGRRTAAGRLRRCWASSAGAPLAAAAPPQQPPPLRRCTAASGVRGCDGAAPLPSSRRRTADGASWRSGAEGAAPRRRRPPAVCCCPERSAAIPLRERGGRQLLHDGRVRGQVLPYGGSSVSLPAVPPTRTRSQATMCVLGLCGRSYQNGAVEEVVQDGRSLDGNARRAG